MWGNRRDRDLERRLRSDRPRPREEFVRMVSRQAPTVEPIPRRRVAPRAALVVAVTGLLVASLGVAGALGSAASSLHAFSNNIVHIVAPPSGGNVSQSSLRNQGGSSVADTQTSDDPSGPGSGNFPFGTGNSPFTSGDFPFGNGNSPFGDGFPFNHEYGITLPICENGQIVNVPIGEYVYLLLHGGRPAFFCTFTLTVARIGTGRGSVSSSPAGISCGPTCTAKFSTSTTSVTLTETPDPGSTFKGWSGACSGTGACVVPTNNLFGLVIARFSAP
jgi:hypothetical protein